MVAVAAVVVLLAAFAASVASAFAAGLAEAAVRAALVDMALVKLVRQYAVEGIAEALGYTVHLEMQVR